MVRKTSSLFILDTEQRESDVFLYLGWNFFSSQASLLGLCEDAVVVLALEVLGAGDRTVVLAVRLEEPNVDLGLAGVEARADEPDLAL